jgi:hypothetical protein
MSKEFHYVTEAGVKTVTVGGFWLSETLFGLLTKTFCLQYMATVFFFKKAEPVLLKIIKIERFSSEDSPVIHFVFSSSSKKNF